MYANESVCGDFFAYYFSCTRKRSIDVVTDILSSYKFHQACLIERFENVLVNARQYELDAAMLGAQVELLKIVNASTVNKRYLTHTYDTHFLVVFTNTAANLIELIGDAEEIWSINLIYLGVCRDMQHLKVLTMKTYVGLMGGV